LEITIIADNDFSRHLLQWFDTHGRKDLPWQQPRNAYRVWISEIMLQQTQVQTVIPYFNRFMVSFPDIYQLAIASEDMILAHWSGLGYYSRARYIAKTARIICNDFAGCFPKDLAQLTTLPGIGPSTAAAIASLAFNQPTAILDGNVKRVLSRYFMVDGHVNQSVTNKRLWQLANQCMSQSRCADYTQAIMDFGATQCTTRTPNCTICPVQNNCLAYINNCVSTYPMKKVKKTLPIKQQQFLLLFNHQQQVYLEKRPPVGLWGSLWSIPAIALTESVGDFINQHYGFIVLQTIDLLEMKHSFSHFHLYIKAYAIEVKDQSSQIAEPKGRWFDNNQLINLGLAKPTHDIINHFFNLKNNA
jgi:A/G-specific adenine glycosylase